MTSERIRTQVAIIGAGPAGSLMAHLLHRAGIESVVLERRSKEYVLGRIRAGVLEQSAADLLRAVGLGERMDAKGFRHGGVALSHDLGSVRVDFQELVGRQVTIWGQTEVQADLFAALEVSDVPLYDEAEGATLHDLTTDQPRVTFSRAGSDYEVLADWVVGCDGAHGPSRQAFPDEITRVYDRSYPFGWLGVLSETPPVSDELIYASHERGFALCSMRHAMLSRYYVQCDLEDTVDDWSDDRFWTELTARLPEDAADRLVTGPSIEKSITPLRSTVIEPMRHGRLLLAGDSAHIVPPTGAKGLNLAIADVARCASALAAALLRGDDRGVDTYSETALTRVWNAVRFSWWMTTLLHRFPERTGFDRKLQVAELHHLGSSVHARAALADNYTGLPFEVGEDFL